MYSVTDGTARQGMIVYKNTWVENMIEYRIMFFPRGFVFKKAYEKISCKKFQIRSILKEKIVFAF